MRFVFLIVPALLLAGLALAEQDRRSPLDPKAKVPAVEYNSAFEGYRPFTEQHLANWRRSNDEVGAAGGHAGQRPSQGPGEQTSKPQPGKPESGHGAHGGHK
jgi:hypothetical protein